jgi:hypothetical protein
MDRRNFLIGSLGGSISIGAIIYGVNKTTWLDQFKPKGIEHLFICDTPENSPTVVNGVTITNPGSVRGLVVETGEIFAVNLPFFGHTVTQRPRHKHELVVMEKWGQRGAIIDVASREIKSSFKTEGTNLFFGHASFDRSGQVFVSAEDTYDRDKGQLVVRDGDSGKIVSILSSGGTNPHECRTSPDGKHVIVVNEGRGPKLSNLAWVELASGRLAHKVDLPATFGHCSHVNLSPDGWAVLCGKPHTQTAGDDVAPIVILSPNGQMRKAQLPDSVRAALTDEALSIAFLEGTDLVGVTVPASNLVLLINYKSGQLVESLEAIEPKGIISGRQPRSVIVTSASQREITQFELTTPNENPITQTLNSGFGGNGSHMIRAML